MIQSLLLAVGFFAIGLPAAGLWTVVLLLLCIVQVPAVLVTLPIIVYVFATKATQPAIIFLVWTLIAGLSDNILKPLMLGRGLEVPMPVILIGVIGGMIADGLLGLFVGPVVLAVGYVVLIEWMQQRRARSGRPHRSDTVRCHFCCRHASGAGKLASVLLPNGGCLDDLQV